MQKLQAQTARFLLGWGTEEQGVAGGGGSAGGAWVGGEGEVGRKSTLHLDPRGLDLRPWQIMEDSVSLPVKGNTNSKLAALS